MGMNCCIRGCQYRSDFIKFYKFSSKNTLFEQRRRRDWLQAIKRDDWKRLKWSESRISKQRICSFHFISGEMLDDPNNIDWIPTKFTHSTAVQRGPILLPYEHIPKRCTLQFSRLFSDAVELGF